MNLNLIDISNFLYRGSYSLDKFHTIDGKKCGGVFYTLDYIQKIANNKDEYVVAIGDRKCEYRKNIYPEYKENRKKKKDAEKKENISYQRKLIEEVLDEVGIQVISLDGYEADDIIYSLTKRYRTTYAKVFIHSSDKDLLVSVRDNVYQIFVDKGRILVDANTAPNYLDKEYKIISGTVSLYKTIFGDIGDGIPNLFKYREDSIKIYLTLAQYALTVEDGDRRLLDVFKGYPEEFIRNLKLVLSMPVQLEIDESIKFNKVKSSILLSKL